MVDVGEEKGTIDENEKKMINNVFEFNDIMVSEIMIPRTEIFALNMDLTISEALEKLDGLRYSRIPIYDENIDDIKGILYVKDLLLYMKSKNTKIKTLMKDAYFVSETKTINEFFDELRKNRKQIAIVVDEYGGTSGIVTMEDILEEIVGEIYDEYDHVDEAVKKLDENTFILSGNIAIYEFENLLETTIEEGDYDTLSGYLVDKLGNIPTKKDEGITIEDENILYKIEKVKDKHISKVKVCKIKNL